MAKERSDSTLGGLPLHQQEQLITWLIEERISMQTAVARVRDDFGVRSSLTAMYRFWGRHCAPRLLRYAAEASDALPEAAGGLTDSWDKSSEQYLKQKYFELLSKPGMVDPKELIAFGQLVQNGQMLALKARELTSKEEGFRLKYQQKEREIELAEAKFENAKFKVAEQTKKLREKGATITEEERQKIVGEVDRILGIA